MIKKEIESIWAQSLKPDKIVIYIAEGYNKPTGIPEGNDVEYVFVPKGMITQRVLDYDEISSEYILLLDDDIYLGPNAAWDMLNYMESNNLDAIGIDIFEHHKHSFSSKLYRALFFMILPLYSNKFGVKVRSSLAPSYNYSPKKDFYFSQSCTGGAIMVKKETFLKLNMNHEVWLEQIGYPHCDDLLLSFKYHRNGYRLGILYNSGSEHLNGRASHSETKNDANTYWMTFTNLLLWYRCIYQPSSNIFARFYSAMCYIFKCLWIILFRLVFMTLKRNKNILFDYTRGLRDGFNYIRDGKMKRLPPYVLPGNFRRS